MPIGSTRPIFINFKLQILTGSRSPKRQATFNRKNTQQSQRNLYFQSGVSSEGLDSHFYGIHGDWETRRWFTGFGYKQVKTDLEDYSSQYIQLGVAPYLGEYGDLHTWIMLKSKKNSLLDDWSTYPVLKFFKGDFLIELGYSDKKYRKHEKTLSQCENTGS